MEELANNLPAGYVLYDYSIREVLGAGSFGITYKAYDNLLQKWVAIKEFLPSEMAERGSDRITVQPRKDASEKFRFGLDRFLEEARTLARFDHPNIVGVGRFLEANGTAYLVMDYVQGQSLLMYLRHHATPVSEALLKAWFVPILQGLVAVHAAGFLHRDIKPGNIYLRDNGEPVLIDFGAARQAIGEQSRSVTGIFTPGYAPTEQYGTDPKKQGPWTDLYSVGATLYRCISGNTPIDAPTRQSALVEGDADPLVLASVQGLGEYSTALLELIDKLMVLPIKDRPQTAAPVLAALIAGNSEIEAEPRSRTVSELTDKSGRPEAEAETVLVFDRHRASASKDRISQTVAPAQGVDESSIKRLNLKALRVIGALLILGLLATVTILMQRNSSEVRNREAAEQLRAACAKNPVCMLSAGSGVLLNPATGLEWTQADNREDIGWSEATAWCASKGEGWSLPTAQEFASIYDSSATTEPVRCGQANCYVSPLFQLSSPFFWRSEVTRSDAGAQQVGFFSFNEDLGSQPDEGELTEHKGLRALCVRHP